MAAFDHHTRISLFPERCCCGRGIWRGDCGDNEGQQPEGKVLGCVRCSFPNGFLIMTHFPPSDHGHVLPPKHVILWPEHRLLTQGCVLIAFINGLGNVKTFFITFFFTFTKKHKCLFIYHISTNHVKSNRRLVSRAVNTCGTFCQKAP